MVCVFTLESAIPALLTGRARTPVLIRGKSSSVESVPKLGRGQWYPEPSPRRAPGDNVRFLPAAPQQSRAPLTDQYPTLPLENSHLQRQHSEETHVYTHATHVCTHTQSCFQPEVMFFHVHSTFQKMLQHEEEMDQVFILTIFPNSQEDAVTQHGRV